MRKVDNLDNECIYHCYHHGIWIRQRLAWHRASYLHLVYIYNDLIALKLSGSTALPRQRSESITTVMTT